MTFLSTGWTIQTWQPGVDSPGREVLQSLRAGRLGLVRFRDLLDGASLADCQKAINHRRAAATVSQYVNGALTTLGPYLARHLADPDRYFAQCRAVDELFPDPARDLRTQVRESLRRAFDLRSLGVARERDGRHYADAVVRLHVDGVGNPLHNDHIARDAAGTGLVLAGLRSQFSCVVCLQECTTGGELLLYRKPWEPADECFKIAGGLGYDESVVAGRPCLVFKPETADVYVMSPTNYHAINRVRGAERRTLGFFFGFLDEAMEDGIAWS